MKYQKGDKVVIRKDLEVGKKYGSVIWTEKMTELLKLPYLTVSFDFVTGIYSVEETGYTISEEMISHKYEEEEAVDTKYQKGDKVVLRKDLDVGNKYGNLTWLEGMEFMKNKFFTSILRITNQGNYLADTGLNISEEMISHKYEEENTMDTGFQKGDKVVIRQDLKVGKKYGNVTWLDGMESMKNMLFTSIIQRAEERTYLTDTGWAISEEMISHKYKEQEETKYQKGDKVVLRKDLEPDVTYSGSSWVEGMQELSELPYVEITDVGEHKDSGKVVYFITGSDYVISDEMISHKYEEQHSESDNETEAEPELFVWYCEDEKYVHVLCCDGTVYTMSKNPDNQDKINKILEGYSDSFLLPLEEAKKSALYLVLKRVEVKKPKMYYIRMGLGNLSYVNYDVEEEQYFLSSKVETKHERTMFTEEEANKIVGTDSILVKEEVE